VHATSTIITITITITILINIIVTTIIVGALIIISALRRERVMWVFIIVVGLFFLVQAHGHENLLSPKLVVALKERQERVVQISLTNTETSNAHTLALTESGRLYAFGAGDKGQLGVELLDNESERGTPQLVVDVDMMS
jgi:drug/metabolite transporter (DMT)-like permease